MKNILLAVSGSIACYKAYDLLRDLKKENPGCSIKVVLTSGAQKFLKPDLFKYLGAEQCFEAHDDFDTSLITHEAPVLHINLARWTDLFVLYPASANTLAKLSRGQADDLLSSVFLSLKPSCKKILYPAMNTQMYENPITQKNIKTLSLLENLQVCPPDSGELLCGEKGDGKLPLPKDVAPFLLSLSDKPKSEKILITTGATESPLDTVRYLTNPASGKTGFLLTREALSQGYKVVTIATRSSKHLFECLHHNKNFRLISVKTTEEMLSAALDEFSNSNLYISAAAPCDINFEAIHLSGKMKKSQLTESLKISKTPDILSEILKQRTSSQKVIGFAAESHDSAEIIQEKLSRKKVDLLVANEVHSGFSGELKGFQVDSGQYRFCTTKNPYPERQLLSKWELATNLLKWYQTKLRTYDHLQDTI